MKLLLLSLLLAAPLVQGSNHLQPADHPPKVPMMMPDPEPTITESLYLQINLEQAGLPFTIFNQALIGFQRLQSEGRLLSEQFLTIIDFDRSANQERLWIIDLENHSLWQKTLVAHGRNSGELYARQFSNRVSSHMSSLGFYITGKPYHGKHGLSLRLQGMEPGINDQAESRAIVMHGADYVSQDFINRNGRLGRSHGCPAVPRELASDIITQIANGTCLFIYHSDPDYQESSTLVKS